MPEYVTLKLTKDEYDAMCVAAQCVASGMPVPDGWIKRIAELFEVLQRAKG